MEWIDIALRDDEAGVSAAIGGLDAVARKSALEGVADVLGLSRDEVERAALRLLVERVRLLALPAALWSRSLDASDDPADLVRAHFKRRRIAETPDRVRRAIRLYRQFAAERDKRTITEATLTACGFRCQHCGIAFCDEQLASRAITSPFRLRRKPKTDAFKPHWHHEPTFLEPTIDHHWPVSLFGDNRPENLKVLCKGCNIGKEDFLALEQLRPSVGLTPRQSLLTVAPVQWAVFYAQLRRHPTCSDTGKKASEAELTVRLKDTYAPTVLDNLETVESPGV
jgi:5-methylcytosine-specific restriction endonuclease McrA